MAVSQRGLAADACAELTIYHNGRVIAAHRRLAGESLETALRDRVQTSGLPLQPGDALAFRFGNASYHCFGNLVRAQVGDKLLTSAPTGGLAVRFARARIPGWTTPDFDITAHAATDEASAQRGQFLPMRARTLEKGVPIVEGADLWKPADQASKDHRLANWYWRVDVPK